MNLRKKLLLISTVLVILILSVIILQKDNIFHEVKAAPQDDKIIADNLNQDLIKLNNQYISVSPREKAGLLSQIVNKAKSRKEKMKQLLISDPEKFISSSFPTNLAKSFPKEAMPYLEQQTEISGKLGVRIYDNFEGQISKYEYYLDSGDQNQTLLYFVKEKPSGNIGAKVRVNGTRLDSEMAVQSSNSPYLMVISPSFASGPGAKKTAVILFNFQNDTSKPLTSRTVNNVTYTDSNSVNNYIKENSFNKVWMEGITNVTGGDVFGYYTIPYNSSSGACDLYHWGDAAKLAAYNAGATNIYNYGIWILAMPATSICGSSTAGVTDLMAQNSFIMGTNYTSRVVSHEYIHNFWIFHAGTLNCKDANNVRVSISSNCTFSEYGDPFDVMGSGSKHLNAGFKYKLNWIDQTANAQNVVESGTYALYPQEQSSSGVQVLRIPRERDMSGGNATSYFFVEYRRPFGFDNFANNDPVVNGASIRLYPQMSTQGAENIGLIDTTSSTLSYLDSALAVNQTFYDQVGDITFKTISTNSSSLTIQITLGPSPCLRTNPSISSVPIVGPAVVSGTPVAYNIQVTNNNTGNCSSTTYDLRTTLYSPWIASYALTPLIIANQATGNTVLTVTSALGTADKNYNFTASATNKSIPQYKANILLTYWINSDPPLTFYKTANPESTTAGGTITYIINIQNNAPSTYTSTVLTDNIPANTVYVPNSADSSGGSYDIASNTITWTIGNLAPVGNPASQKQVSFQVKVN